MLETRTFPEDQARGSRALRRGTDLRVARRRVDRRRRERRIQRRRRGKPEPYAPTTIPGYRRDLNNLLKPRFGERPADGIDEREWQDFFDELARDGLSHSRLANVKAVASSIYAWALHRTRRQVASNPLRYIELLPNIGKRRERVALAEEAERLLALLEPKDQVPYGIAFYAGLRRGEIDRLDWLDVEMIEGKPGNWLGSRRRRESPATGGACQSPSRDDQESSPLRSSPNGRRWIASRRPESAADDFGRSLPWPRG
jgi:site-specific recombinase XerC